MAITLNLFDIFRRKQASGNGAVNLASLTVKMSIHTNAYTPNQNTHDFHDDATNEVSGTGYAAGGNTLANPVVSLDGSGNVTIDFDDPAVWSQNGAGFSNGRHLVVYVDRGGASSADELIGYATAAGDFGNVAADLDVDLNASGLITSAR